MDRRQAIGGLAAVLSAQHAPAVRAQTRLIVGQSAPLTGQNAEFGKAIVAGARSWFYRYNRGGTAIEHLVLDDGNDTRRAEPNTAALIERGASVLFGYASATLSLPALPLARQAEVPFFAPFTGASTLHELHDPWIFTARASYLTEAAKFCEVIAGFGARRVAIVHYADRVGNENRDVVLGAVRRSEMTPEPTIAVERNQAVSDNAIGLIRRHQPDAILFTTLAAPTAQIITKARAAGMGRSTFLVTLSFVGPSQMQKLLGDQSRGIVISHVVPRPWSTLEIAREHAQAMRASGSDEVPSFASLESYIAAKALTTAIEKSKVQRGAGIALALEALNVDVGGYRLRYARNNHHGSNFVDYTILGQDFVS